MRSDAEYSIIKFDELKELAKLAPSTEKKKKSPTPTKPKGKKSRKNGSQKTDLGRFDVEKYLNQYGVEFNVKPQGDKTLYRLSKCLFNPAHAKNESAIVQSDNGLITYQCFHNSCSGHRWSDARSLISSADSLAPFCANYDPTRAVSSPPPTSDPASKHGFFKKTEKGKKFVPYFHANFLEEHFLPVVCEGKDFGNLFYRYYDSGVWKFLPEAEIGQIAYRSLLEDVSPARVKQSIECLQHNTYAAPETLESDPMILNLQNGMFDIGKMECFSHDPKYNSRIQMPINYDQDATCPDWIPALERIFADDDAKVEVLQQFVGYCLYPRIIFPCALFQIGRGSNGKGTVQKVIQALLGKENVCHISLVRMEDKFGPIELRHKLLNACGETAAKALDPNNFKAICAGDEVQAEVKYQKDVTYVPVAKHMISMNEFPGIKDKTDAFYRRVIVMEYNQSFEGEADDQDLANKLLGQLDGIFLWALEGLKMVLENNCIIVPESVEQGKKRFRESSDTSLTFVAECCVLGEFVQSVVNKITPPDLFRTYKAWCEDGSIPLGKRAGKHKFYEQILTNCRGVIKKREPGGTKEFYFGLGLEPELDFKVPE